MSHVVVASEGLDFLTVLPDIDTIVTVVTDSDPLSMTTDDYQELVARLVAAMS
jgi:hypothetical protein